MQRKFLPFHQIGNESIIVVDALHSRGLILSHWKGGNIHPEIEADTSGEIVLNALQQNFPGLDAKWVTANHFDIDGFVGVFALIFPELAKKYDGLLRQMAIIGDFRELDTSNPICFEAAKLCCWINQKEKELFYRPFAESDEIKLCEEKFDFFLNEFPEVINNIEAFKVDWQEEFQKVLNGLADAKAGQLHTYPEIGLMKRRLKDPIHYYALFSDSYGFDFILSIYDQNRYELEIKYTSWVDISTRKSFPRIDFKPLAEKLNQLETSAYKWMVDKITDTGPILRLEAENLSKADRYDQAYNREIYSSSIPEEQFEKLIISFLQEQLKGIEKKRFWSWNEMREINGLIVS